MIEITEEDREAARGIYRTFMYAGNEISTANTLETVLLLRLESAEAALGNLLAIIHGDGGHYQDAHGTAKAIEDGHVLLANTRLRVNEYESRIAELEAKLKALNEGSSFETWPKWMRDNAVMATASFPKRKKESGNG